jgi:hypothetical protein
MRDIHNSTDATQSINPAARTATVNGAGVDIKGAQSAEVEFDVGTITDGVHTPKLQESDDNAAWNDVVAGDQKGVLAAFATNVHQRVGYIGNKRYLRAVVTVAGGPVTGGVYGALVTRGHLRHSTTQAI